MYSVHPDSLIAKLAHRYSQFKYVYFAEFYDENRKPKKGRYQLTEEAALGLLGHVSFRPVPHDMQISEAITEFDSDNGPSSAGYLAIWRCRDGHRISCEFSRIEDLENS